MDQAGVVGGLALSMPGMLEIILVIIWGLVMWMCCPETWEEYDILTPRKDVMLLPSLVILKWRAKNL